VGQLLNITSSTILGETFKLTCKQCFIMLIMYCSMDLGVYSIWASLAPVPPHRSKCQERGLSAFPWDWPAWSVDQLNSEPTPSPAHSITCPLHHLPTSSPAHSITHSHHLPTPSPTPSPAHSIKPPGFRAYGVLCSGTWLCFYQARLKGPVVEHTVCVCVCVSVSYSCHPALLKALAAF
jgi:hypothetical protein